MEKISSIGWGPHSLGKDLEKLVTEGVGVEFDSMNYMRAIQVSCIPNFRIIVWRFRKFRNSIFSVDEGEGWEGVGEVSGWNLIYAL